MKRTTSFTSDIIAYAESFPDIRAKIACLPDVLDGPSYHAEPEGKGYTAHQEPQKARSVLVLGLRHPADNPRLDWWTRGNTSGNRRLMEISEEIIRWLQKTYGIHAVQLAYHVEKGGLFLKDAAVLSGLGIIGRNNLLLHPEWGPRIRLRAVLIEEELPPTEPLQHFSPCSTCDTRCHRVCPQHAFPDGQYSRSLCCIQMQADVENSVPDDSPNEQGTRNLMIRYCRACEFVCPAGD